MESKNFKSSSKVLSNKKKKIILSKLERKKKAKQLFISPSRSKRAFFIYREL